MEADELTETLARLARNDESLTQLYLTTKGLGDDVGIRIAEALKTNTHLSILYLNSNGLGNATAIALANVLKENNTLTNLFLHKNKITDDGAVALAESLEKNSSLTRLGLSFNRIGEATGQALLKSLSKNTVLTDLDLLSTSIPKSLLEQIRSALSPGAIAKRKKRQSIRLLRQPSTRSEEEAALAASQPTTEAGEHHPHAASKANVSATACFRIKQDVFRDASRGAICQPFGRVKLCFVGQGRAGKTSTLASLNGRPFVKDRESTIGVANESLLVELNQTSLMAWKTHTEEIDAVEKAILTEVIERSSGKPKKKISIFDIMRPRTDSLTSSQRPSINDEEVFPDKSTSDGALSTSVDADMSMNVSGTEDVVELRPVEAQVSSASSAQLLSPQLSSSSEVVAVSEEDMPAQQRHSFVDAISRMSEDFVSHHFRAFDKRLIFDTWDYAGQEVFYSLFHLFLTPNAMYVVLMDMEKILKCLRDGRPAPQPKASGLDEDDALGFLDFWLHSLAHHTSTSGTQPSPIFIVGTHKDKVSDPEDHQFISNQLYLRYSGKPFANAIVENVCSEHQRLLFFPVDNTLSDADPMIQTLRCAIEVTAEGLDFTKATLPLSWLRFFDMLQYLSKPENLQATHKNTSLARELRQLHDPNNKGIPKLSLEEVRRLGVECGIANCAPDAQTAEVWILEALSLCHQVGCVLHFRHPSVQDIIFLKPQYLIDRITRIVRDFRLHHLAADKSLKNARQLERLRTRGVLVKSLLEDLWSDNTPAEREIFLQLMLQFQIAVPLVRKDNFLIPGLLKSGGLPDYHVETKGEIYLSFFTWPADMRSEGSTITKSFLSDHGFLPSGLFVRLLCAVINHAQRTNASVEAELSASEVRVHFGAMEFSLELIPRIHSVKVTLYTVYGVPVLERLCQLLESVMQPDFETIEYHALVPFDEERLITLDSVRRAIQSNEPVYWVSPNESYTLSKVRLSMQELGELYSPWLPARSSGDLVDIFISYRQESDHEMAHSLFDCLTTETVGKEGRRLFVFYDQESLELGRQFEKAFMGAIARSTLCVPIVSKGALERMKTLGINGNDRVDNVLLEWSLMIHLEEKRIVKRVAPVFVGNPESRESLFRMFNPKVELPNEVSEETYAVLHRFVTEDLGLDPPPRRTVSETITALFKYNSEMRSWSFQRPTQHGGGSKVPSDSSSNKSSQQSTPANSGRASKSNSIEETSPIDIHANMGMYLTFSKAIVRILEGVMVETPTATSTPSLLQKPPSFSRTLSMEPSLARNFSGSESQHPATPPVFERMQSIQSPLSPHPPRRQVSQRHQEQPEVQVAQQLQPVQQEQPAENEQDQQPPALPSRQASQPQPEEGRTRLPSVAETSVEAAPGDILQSRAVLEGPLHPRWPPRDVQVETWSVEEVAGFCTLHFLSDEHILDLLQQERIKGSVFSRLPLEYFRSMASGSRITLAEAYALEALVYEAKAYRGKMEEETREMAVSIQRNHSPRTDAQLLDRGDQEESEADTTDMWEAAQYTSMVYSFAGLCVILGAVRVWKSLAVFLKQ